MCLIDKNEKSLMNKKNKTVDKVMNYFKCDFKSKYKSQLNQHINSVHKNIRIICAFGTNVDKVLL
jgi:hypothetical protein